MTHTELFGTAKWIAPDKACDQPVFRLRFDAQGAQAARITISGLGFFELYLNGEKISGDLLVPAWTSYEHASFPEHGHKNAKKHFPDNSIHRVYALQYDLALQPGENELRVYLGAGWYRKWYYGSKVKCCFKMDFPDGQALCSDEPMEWSPTYITKSEMLVGERHDYTKEETWRPVRAVNPPESEFEIQTCPADGVIRTIVPKHLGGGIYDCGENITGWPVLRLLGKRVKVSYAENIDGIKDYGANWRQSDTFISHGTPREATPREVTPCAVHAKFMWHAFRFFKIEGKAELLRVEVVHANVPAAASFESNNETLNWLFEAFVRTQLCNMHCGIPSDCPQYEGRGYTGDGQLACDAALLCLDGREFYAKWMRDIADGQDRETGHICYTAPFIPSGGGPGGWGCAIAHVPWVYYQTCGDSAPLREYYPNMRRYLDYLELHSEGDLVTSEEPGNWCLGDWCCPDEEYIPGKRPVPAQLPPPFVNNYFYIKTLREMTEIARLIGREEDIPGYEATERCKIAAIMREYYDPATGDFFGNKQGANAFAVDLGLGDERTLANMVAHYEKLRQYDTGIFGTDILTRVLFDHGYAQLAFALLSGAGDASYENMKRLGGTTLWEYWNGHRSHSHPMFGAVVQYLFRDLLGIRQRPGTTGYTDVIVRPANIPGLCCKGYISTNAGRIEVETNAGKVNVCAAKGIKTEAAGE